MRALLALGFVLLAAGCLVAVNEPQRAEATIECNQSIRCYAAGMKAGETDQCLFNMSYECRDSRLCAKIINQELEHQCRIRNGEYSPGLCPRIANQTMRDECYFHGAQTRDDNKACDAINDSQDRSMCTSNIAYRSGNRSFCTGIRDENTRDFCFAVADKDLGMCQGLPDEMMNICIQWVGGHELEDKTTDARP
jgi:hypothetical protein